MAENQTREPILKWKTKNEVFESIMRDFRFILTSDLWEIYINIHIGYRVMS